MHVAVVELHREQRPPIVLRIHDRDLRLRCGLLRGKQQRSALALLLLLRPDSIWTQGSEHGALGARPADLLDIRVDRGDALLQVRDVWVDLGLLAAGVRPAKDKLRVTPLQMAVSC